MKKNEGKKMIVFMSTCHQFMNSWATNIKVCSFFYGKTWRQACLTANITWIHVLKTWWHELFCNFIKIRTFGHETTPGIGFHYHKQGMHTKEPSWKFSKLRQCLDHLQSKGILHLLTSPNTTNHQGLIPLHISRSISDYLNVIVVNFMP